MIELTKRYHSPFRLPPIFIMGIMFFVFGFVSWINAILIPYFKMVCELTALQSMMVAFAFYISYFIMALPSSWILQKTGFKNGMIIGLFIMAVGALFFIPAAFTRMYPLFLIGLFIQATGLTILQSASNPYVTILGPMESAAKRISIMGICNKVAGAIAPVILIQSITKGPDEIDQLQMHLKTAAFELKITILDQLGTRLIIPYVFMMVVFLLLCVLIKYTHLPDIDETKIPDSKEDISYQRKNIFSFPYAWLGAITMFCIVGVEVLSVDSIINYAQFKGYSFKDAKYFATYTLIIMIIGYLCGIIAIPKLIIQRKVLQLCAVIGFFFTILIIVVPGQYSVWFVSLLGIANALLWPSIWPLAIDGLGKFTKQGSALLIMGVAGGAITPLLYGMISDAQNPQIGYVILFPLYGMILFYGSKGYRWGKQVQ